MKQTNWKMILLIVFLVLIALGIYKYGQEELVQPTLVVRELKLSSCSEKIYLKKLNWGWTGDAQIVIISGDSKRPKIPPDSTTQYIFYGLNEFFYKVQENTLVVYTSARMEEPTDFPCEIAVLHIKLKGYEALDMRKTHESKGIKWLQ